MAPELREEYGQDKMQPEQMQEKEGEEREKERKAWIQTDPQTRLHDLGIVGSTYSD